MPPEFMQPSRWGYFITIIGAGITPGSAWRRSAWRPLRANARRYLSMSPRSQVLAGTGGQSAVTPRGRRHSYRRARFASAPDAPPLSSDPERFHAQRSVIAHDLAELARRHRAESQTHLRARGRTLGKEAWPDGRRRHPSHQRQTGNGPVTPCVRCRLFLLRR